MKIEINGIYMKENDKNDNISFKLPYIDDEFCQMFSNAIYGNELNINEALHSILNDGEKIKLTIEIAR